jgi:hypothetical protein
MSEQPLEISQQFEQLHINPSLLKAYPFTTASELRQIAEAAKEGDEYIRFSIVGNLTQTGDRQENWLRTIHRSAPYYGSHLRYVPEDYRIIDLTLTDRSGARVPVEYVPDFGSHDNHTTDIYHGVREMVGGVEYNQRFPLFNGQPVMLFVGVSKIPGERPATYIRAIRLLTHDEAQMFGIAPVTEIGEAFEI